MRDFIWTLIIIWTIYQLSALFRNRKKAVHTVSSRPTASAPNPSEQAVKSSLRKASDQEGEYVDFEELK
jgi:hypothetical protein